MKDRFELIIIGGGPAGYTAAIRAAQNGMDVALIEKEDIGGTCLNRGCIPAKSLLHSSEKYAEMKGGSGVVLCDNLRYDLSKIYAERDEVVFKLRSGIEKLLAAKKIEVIKGQAVFVSPTEIEVGGAKFTAEKFIIATGGKVSMLPITGADLCVNSNYLLKGEAELPDNIIIIGGGVIGVEFATYLTNLDKSVYILEYADRILPLFDRDVSLQLALNLRKKGVKISTSAMVKKVEKTLEGFTVTFEEKGTEKTVEAGLVIMCAGRRADTDELELSSAGVETQKGAVKVDKNFKTNIDNIYAIGDCVGGIQLAHFASAQGDYLADYLAGVKSDINLSVVPGCVYTNPEIASVGMTQAECVEKGIEVEIGKFPMGANGKSVITGSGGFVKTIFEKSTGKLLGALLYCDRATDIIGELALAVANGLDRKAIEATIHPHPTVCEAVCESALSSTGKAIHIL